MLRREIKFSVFSLLLLALFNGTANATLFNGCDHTFNINPGSSFLESPDYPYSYEPGTSCRYKFVAPLDYEIKINCTIYLDKSASSACSSEFFYVAVDGDTQLRGSEKFCGYGNIIRNSLFNSIVVAYESRGSWGNFQCELTATPQSCDCGWSVNTRIVNGIEANINEYPSIVALKDILAVNDPPFCSGTIIGHRHIVTAAHCTRLKPMPSRILAMVGQHDLNNPNRYSEQYAIQQIFEHPSYTPSTTANDIAILLTVNNLQWSRGVGPACLPPYNYYNSFEYNDVDVVGWGSTGMSQATMNKLQKVTLLIQTNSVCQTEYQGVAPINDTQICTYDSSGTYKDSCQYDSGGPNYLRLSRQFIIGLISFGKECGVGFNNGYPIGVNTRITSYLTWIYNTIGTGWCQVQVK